MVREGRRGLVSPEVFTDFDLHELFVNRVHGPAASEIAVKEIPDALRTTILEGLSRSNVVEIQKALTQTANSRLALNSNSPDSVVTFVRWYTGYELDPHTSWVSEVHEWIRKEFSNFFVAPITFVNGKAWENGPETPAVGAFKPHTDGFPAGHYKVMLYPYGVGPRTGNIEISGSRLEETENGLALAFDNSSVMHRAIAPTEPDGKRLVLELTVLRTVVPGSQVVESNFNGRYLPTIAEVYRGFRTPSSGD